MTKYIVSILVFLLLVGGAYWFYTNKQSSEQLVKNTTVEKNNTMEEEQSGNINQINNENIPGNTGDDIIANDEVSLGRDVTGEEINEPGTEVSDEQINDQIDENEPIEELSEPDTGFSHSGELVDVSGGQAAGIAQAGFVDGTYNLLAEFANLPDPAVEFFYEGWVVRQQPLSVVSTGEVKKLGNVYKNVFNVSQNLIDHTFYVLTIEPDDGDPAPADHILEGTMSKL